MILDSLNDIRLVLDCTTLVPGIPFSPIAPLEPLAPFAFDAFYLHLF
jgi:hypothetical protein